MLLKWKSDAYFPHTVRIHTQVAALLIEGETDNRPVRPFIERCVLTKQENALLRSVNTRLVLEQQKLFDEIEQLKNTHFNTVVDLVALKLKEFYPEHRFINAYCAAIRSMKR